MDWLTNTLAIAGVTLVFLAVLLWSSAHRLGAGRPLQGPVRSVDLATADPEGWLRDQRPRWLDAGIEAGAPMVRGTDVAVVLGFRGQRWELTLGPTGARLRGPDGEAADALLALLLAR